MSLKRLPAPMDRSILFLLEDKRFISYFSYLDSISLKMTSNCWTESPVNDLNSNGFLDNRSYVNKKKVHLYARYTEIKLFVLITQEVYYTAVVPKVIRKADGTAFFVILPDTSSAIHSKIPAGQYRLKWHTCKITNQTIQIAWFWAKLVAAILNKQVWIFHGRYLHNRWSSA